MADPLVLLARLLGWRRRGKGFGANFSVETSTPRKWGGTGSLCLGSGLGWGFEVSQGVFREISGGFPDWNVSTFREVSG